MTGEVVEGLAGAIRAACLRRIVRGAVLQHDDAALALDWFVDQPAGERIDLDVVERPLALADPAGGPRGGEQRLVVVEHEAMAKHRVAGGEAGDIATHRAGAPGE